MKTRQILGLMYLGLFSTLSIGQNVQSNSLGTSGGLGAGTTVSPNSGNTYYGYGAGAPTSISSRNTCIGDNAGNVTGGFNVYLGYNAGKTVGGSSNIYIGSDVCTSTVPSGTSSGSANVVVGTAAGNTGMGYSNVFLGNGAGKLSVGSSNVFIGSGAGSAQTTDSNKLFIANSNTATPLIWGDFAASQLKFNGAVSINTALTPSGYKLAVGGKIIAEELKIQLQTTPPWPDYVFAKDYKLPTLLEVEQHIKDKGHLAGVPSAQEVKENGIEVGNMAIIQQEKIEELTLYIIELNKKLEAQAKKMEALEAKINQ